MTKKSNQKMGGSSRSASRSQRSKSQSSDKPRSAARKGGSSGSR